MNLLLRNKYDDGNCFCAKCVKLNLAIKLIVPAKLTKSVNKEQRPRFGQVRKSVPVATLASSTEPLASSTEPLASYTEPLASSCGSTH